MRIALSADFHLDMRQFNSQQRWLDFLDTFTEVTRKVRDLQADAFVMAGDIFHKYRPHPGIIRRFLRETANLDCPVILIRGNHDSPQILFEKYGGDTLHLIHDVADIVYLNRKNPTYEMGNICFLGVGYIGFNVRQEIERYVRGVLPQGKIRIGVFHQLLDYPGVPEDRAEISRSFLKGLGFDIVLMGHYHVAYSETQLFNPGSPEYWAFDQGEQITVDLDTDQETVKPAKNCGFYLIETEKRTGKFIKVKPARPMYCITFTTRNYLESTHLPKIKEQLVQYNIEGAMVKSVIQGRYKLGQMNLRQAVNLEKPLIHITATRLTPTRVLPEKGNIIQTQTEYLSDQGIDKAQAQALAEWLEHDKEKLAEMESKDLLNALREILHREDPG